MGEEKSTNYIERLNALRRELSLLLQDIYILDAHIIDLRNDYQRYITEQALGKNNE